MVRWNEALRRAPALQNHQRGDKMSKVLSILVAAIFAVSTGSVFAASHTKAAPAEKKEEMKKDAKPAEKKAEKKEAKKEEKKAEKKEAKKEAKKEEKKEEKKEAKK
jgi:hypothetical protein